MTARILQEADRRILLIDGAMGTSIHALKLDVDRDFLGKENCSEILLKTRPDLIQQIHESFLAVGADAVETNTFGANALVLADFGLASEAYALNKQAAEIALAACERHATPDKPRFVLGSIGPGTKLITLGNTTWNEMHGAYIEQAHGLIAGGCDALIIETCQDLLQVKCAVSACLDALSERNKTPGDLPIMVQVTMESTGTMLLGSDLGAVISTLESYPVMSMGLNCATGPKEMTEHVHELVRHWRKLISIVPNAGMPILVGDRTEFPLSPDEFADVLEHFVELGVNIVGGCCGTTPAHIEAIAKRLQGRKPLAHPRSHTPHRRAVASLYSAVELTQDTSILLVGERTNANGSMRFKSLLEAQDWDGMVSMAREQIRDGSHVIDVCVDSVGRDGEADMTQVVSRFVRQVDCPLMLDSTDPKVIEAGLKLAGGKCIVNSISLEDGEKRFNDICPMLRRYGTAVVALTIDDDPQAGMAKTAKRKLEIARRMRDLFTDTWKLDERDLLIDPLTFTIATGNDDDRALALETLDGVEAIAHALPECGIILGISNVSFGLKPAARTVLNSVFMHEAMHRGLTAAIVHASKILPRTKISDRKWNAALDLIYDRRTADHDPLLDFISLFPDDEQAPPPAAAESLTIEQQLQRHIIDGEKQDLEKHLDEARDKYTPLQIVNDHLLTAMQVVGELFGRGEMQLPFVLQSAEVMKAAVTHLEPFMERADASNKATIILATVRGDVHDIGKNLVDIILTNNGYNVVNLGIKQPIANIIAACEEHNADVIGLSALLVKSVGVMEENLHELNDLGVTIPVLLGGAALTRAHCENTLRNIYHGQTHYAKDAFDGLRMMDRIAAEQSNEPGREIQTQSARRASQATQQHSADENPQPLTAAPAAVSIPESPFWGTHVIDAIDLDDVYAFINTTALFRSQWGFKRGALSREVYNQTITDTVEPLFERLKTTCRDEAILQPKVVYGYFPCNGSGDDLIIYDPNDHGREIERFTFPRQAGRKHLCIADFFRSVDSGERDVVALSCVTMGSAVSECARALFDADEYTEYLYVHGMGVECAEALAELWHQRVRRELGIAGDDSTRIRELFARKYRGSRYSFGYAACPNLSDQDKLFRLLRPERIGCTLTSAWQIVPEQSTSAIIAHHPEAKYFSV